MKTLLALSTILLTSCGSQINDKQVDAVGEIVKYVIYATK